LLNSISFESFMTGSISGWDDLERLDRLTAGSTHASSHHVGPHGNFP